MERLDTLVAKVLADARRAMEERAGGVEAPGKAARAWEGNGAPALARGDAHGRAPAMERSSASKRLFSAANLAARDSASR